MILLEESIAWGNAMRFQKPALFTVSSLCFVLVAACICGYELSACPSAAGLPACQQPGSLPEWSWTLTLWSPKLQVALAVVSESAMEK